MHICLRFRSTLTCNLVLTLRICIPLKLWTVIQHVRICIKPVAHRKPFHHPLRNLYKGLWGATCKDDFFFFIKRLISSFDQAKAPLCQYFDMQNINMNKNSTNQSPTLKPTGYHPPSSGIFRFIPAVCVPYAELMRLDRPAGYYAFYWHYLIGLSFAACIAFPAPSPTTLLSLTTYLGLWVVILRGATCTWNDNLDQEFDRQVMRTRFRPIARGAVTTTQAHIFTLAQTILGTLMLIPLSSAVSVYASIMTAILLIYPLGKRITHFPQVILGVGLAMPVFMCCAVLKTDPFIQPNAMSEGITSQNGNADIDVNRRHWGAACLYAASLLWTIIFDTVYAHQDIKDDVKAGVKSLAVRLGKDTKTALSLLSVVQVGLLISSGYLCAFSRIYFLLGCGGVAAALGGMLVFVQLDKPSSCAWWFGPGSKLVGASLVGGLLGEYVVRLY